MARMKRIRQAFIVTFISSGILGMLLGAVLFNALISVRIDKYLEEIVYLKNIIEDKDTRLKKLEESINKQKYILSDISINFTTDKDSEEVDKVTLEKYIKDKYTNLIGKEIKDIDIELAAEVIHKRIMKLDGHEYQLEVKRIMLSDILSIWVGVKKISLNN